MASWDVGGFASQLDVVGKKMAGGTAAAAKDIAQYILAEAVKRVPVEDHDLEVSGKVTTDDSAGKAAVSFDTPYAVVQHEDMTMHHDEGRSAKYLETAFASAGQGPAAAIIKRRMKMGS